MASEVEIQPRGAFSLEAAAGFGFGPTEGRPPPFDGAMRLAFPVDGGTGYAGVVLRQPSGDPDGPVIAELHTSGGADPEAALAQAQRTVSLDHDGAAFEEIGERDPVLRRLIGAHRGQRPVLFHSPWEGAAWSIVSARRPARVAAGLRSGLAERFGASFQLAGETLHAFPQPERLTGLAGAAGIAELGLGLGDTKLRRLEALAQAAVDGVLDVDRLHELGPERTWEELQTLDGIGPFYAGLVTLRASGFADAMLPMAEPKLLKHAGRLFSANPGSGSGSGEPLTLDALRERAEAWRPFRTWALVLIRLAGERGTF